jgi:uncharacterized membrane protein YhhN
MKKISLILFGIATAGVLLSSLVKIWLVYVICKPMIMISLLFFYLFSTEHTERSRALFLAIVFSFVGDVLLMNDSYFISGLIAFLLAHVMYIFAYRQYRNEPNEGSIQGLQRLRLAFPVILGGTGLIVILYPVLSDLRIPVIIYSIVLMLMVITAIFRMGRTHQSSFWMVLAGAVLFMISDSLIAINKFLDPFAMAGFWVMATYVPAQYLIVRGLIEHRPNLVS